MSKNTPMHEDTTINPVGSDEEDSHHPECARKNTAAAVNIRVRVLLAAREPLCSKTVQTPSKMITQAIGAIAR